MKSLTTLIKLCKDHELSAKEIEKQNSSDLLMSYEYKYKSKILPINRAKIGLELINRGIHPFIKKKD